MIQQTSTSAPVKPLKPLSGTRIVSLALNLPGPAALMRLQGMGADCIKVGSPAGDPMGHYNPKAYAHMHRGMRVLTLDLKTPEGHAALHAELVQAQVLLTSFRPSALRKLALDWGSLHTRHPHLSMVCIVGSPGARAEEPGHDLTYLAENGLVTGTELPATLYADMAGSLAASEAVLQAVLLQKTQGTATHQEVALSDAAAYLALPRQWGLTQPTGAVGGAHAGYRVYPCKDGRATVAALEPHFAAALCKVAGVAQSDMAAMFSPATQQALAAFFSTRSCGELDALAAAHDIPLFCIQNRAQDQ
jgi:alpha-methylacyl-CoA racemase